MNALTIALKDLQVLLKDRGGMFYLFLLPIVFILLFGGIGAGGGGGGGGGETRLEALPVVNLDPGGEASGALVDGLNRAGGVEVVLYGEEEARERLSNAEIWWMLVIPQSFSNDIAAGNRATLRFVSHPDAGTIAATRKASVAQTIAGVTSDMALQTYIVEALQQIGDMQAASSVQSPALTGERYVAQAQSQFQRSQTQPLITVQQTRPASAEVEEPEQSAVSAAYVAGFIVLFVFLAAQTTARSIYDEKRSGSFRRLLASPVGKAELLGGKVVYNLVLTLVQIVVIFIAGTFLFSLFGLGRLGLGNDPLALVLVSLLIAVCSTSLGVLIAAITRTQSQVGGVSTAVLWIAAMIGGTFVPTYFLPAALKGFGQLVPHYWANQAYYDLLARGQTLAGVGPELAALAVFTALFLVVGLWRFDFH